MHYPGARDAQFFTRQDEALLDLVEGVFKQERATWNIEKEIAYLKESGAEVGIVNPFPRTLEAMERQKRKNKRKARKKERQRIQRKERRIKNSHKTAETPERKHLDVEGNLEVTDLQGKHDKETAQTEFLA